MKVICNGFNLYNQLNKTVPVLETLKLCFEEEEIRNFCINHSFSVFQTSDHCLKLYPNNYIDEFKIKVDKIVSNDERILLLDVTGNLYKINIQNSSIIEQIPNFIISDHSDEAVKDISIGARITVAYTNKGSVFKFQNKLNYENAHIIDIKCGKEHCLLLDIQGTVHSFGRGSRGQLGHGKIEDEEDPKLIEALAGLKIIRIAAGGWHSCALSKDGDLYTWGWNGNGQLGISKDGHGENSVAVMASPTVVDFPEGDRNVLMVSCGSRHTVALLDNNQLFGSGWNKYKQLKNEDRENYCQFTYLHSFAEKVMELKCGPWNTSVLY